MNNSELWTCIDDQASVGFTGKINILEVSGKIAGEVIFFEGQVIAVQFGLNKGFKAIFLALISEIDGTKLRYLVEPEIVTGIPKNIHFPLTMLKKMLEDAVAKYLETKGRKPPANVKLLINPAFLEAGDDVSSEEFEVMCIMSDYNLTSEIYRESRLLDFEVTQALVSLRKKKAIKVIGA